MTADDFILEVTSVHYEAWSVLSWDPNYDWAVTKSYDQSTGILSGKLGGYVDKQTLAYISANVLLK